MYAVGMLGSYLTQGVYAVAGSFQPGGAVDIIVVQQEDGTFKSSPWYVKFGDLPGVLKRREKIVDIAVNDVAADFHMFLDNKGEAYFEKEVVSDGQMCLILPDDSSSSGDNRAEGEMERSADADTIVDASSLEWEAKISKTDVTLPEQSGIMDGGEEKSQTEEQASNGQQDLSGIMDFGEEKRMIEEKTSWSHEAMSSKTDIPVPEQNCIAHDSEKKKSMILEETSNGGHELHLELEEDRVLSDLSTKVCSDIPGAFNTEVGLEVSHTQNDNFCIDGVETSNSLTLTVENAQNSNQASHTSLELVEQAGSNTIDTDDGIFHSSTIVTVEETVTLSSVEVVDGLNSNSKVDVEDERLVIDEWTEEGIETDENFEDGMFAGFECITVEGGREKNIYSSEDGKNNDLRDHVGIKQVSNDSLVWDSELSTNQGPGDVTLAISQDSTFLLEDKSGDEEIDSAASEKEITCKFNEGNAIDDAASLATLDSISPPSRWRLWPFWLSRFSVKKGPLSTSLVPEQALLAADVALGSPFAEELLQKNDYDKWQAKTKVRTYVPTSAQLASLNLKDGPNKVSFTFSTVLGNTKMDARIYLWKWNTRIVISDVDGTITKSDVLGQVMPLVGRDWSQYGVTRLFSAIKDNGFEVLFLSARAISQAYLTRRFLLNLKQDGEALPEGPIVISPDGLILSLYREIIKRAPHEFKISCLEEIRELFPKDVNPFYAGFGNRETDKISYLKVGIPKGKIFTINPKGEVVVNHRVDCKSYMSLHALVDNIFPPLSSHEPEDFNAWNFWKLSPLDIDDELGSSTGSKNGKRVSSSKK